ncbi:MAG: DUF5916 domain-containing protein [bacterium]|nr:DUF5916 domain-containing protein [bacterium]
MNVKTPVIVMLFLFMASVSLAQAPSLRAVRVEQAPVLDGKLDDSCWQNAGMSGEFYLLLPTPGGAVTQRTRIYLCHDDQNLYVGAYMHEDQPDRIQASCNQRDGEVYLDDCLEVTIDTYNDKSNAYYFAVNPQSTRTDGRIIDEGRTVDANWDCRWQARASIDSAGWAVEMAIPFGELRFNQADTMSWGINFYRLERPHWETSSWARIDNWCRVSQYGQLAGLAIDPKVKRFELLPFGLSQYQHGTDSLKFRAGLDFKYGITSDLNLNATYLPDFGQIEADQFRFNLSYQQGQELFLAEKRPFFMEGASILYTPIKLFYTRRMNEIEAGAKLYGKIGRAELLCLDVQTKDNDQNFSLLRAKHPLLGQAFAGITATNQQKGGNYSRSAGLDLNLPLYGPLQLTVQTARSANQGITGDEWAGVAEFKSETALSFWEARFFRSGPEFWVSQGFIETVDIDRWGSHFEGYHKFPLSGPFQYLDAGGKWIRKQELGDRMTNNEVGLWTNIVTTGKYRFGLNGGRSFERYGQEEFANKMGVLEFETNVGGMTGIALSYGAGELYDDNFRQATMGLIFLPLSNLTVYPSIFAVRQGSNEWQWISNTRISCQITPRLFARVFIRTSTTYGTPAQRSFQLEDVEDLNSNILLGYEVRPGSMLYLVYNHPRNLITDEFDHYFLAKFSYSIRF